MGGAFPQVMRMWSLSPETVRALNARGLHPCSAYEVKRMSFIVGSKVNVLLEAKVLKQRGQTGRGTAIRTVNMDV